MNIAVVDAGGNLVSHVRMDGAWIGSINISINNKEVLRGKSRLAGDHGQIRRADVGE